MGAPPPPGLLGAAHLGSPSWGARVSAGCEPKAPGHACLPRTRRWRGPCGSCFLRAGGNGAARTRPPVVMALKARWPKRAGGSRALWLLRAGHPCPRGAGGGSPAGPDPSPGLCCGSGPPGGSPGRLTAAALRRARGPAGASQIRACSLLSPRISL